MVKLPAYIYSYEQVRAYLMQLQRAEASILQNKVTEGAQENIFASEEIAPPLKRYLKELHDSGTLNSETLSEFKKFLEEAKDSSPRFKITLGDIAGEELKEKITKWFRENVHETALVSFRYDSDIAGGVVVQSRNKIFDHSFRSRLANPQKKFSEVLREDFTDNS